MNPIDRFLNGQTMYRVVMYGLTALAAAGLVASCFGQVPFGPVALMVSAATLLVVCSAVNFALGYVLDAPRNLESSNITALILLLILLPPSDLAGLLSVAATGAVAMVSKYVLAVRRKHIFNPAAVSLVIMGLLGFGGAVWWVASPALLPVALVAGAMVVRKVRRFAMVGAFLAVAFLSIVLVGLGQGDQPGRLAAEALTSWPLVFFAGFMLTEPLTAPAAQTWRLVYAVAIGTVFGLQYHLGPLNSNPQLALVIGNLFAFALAPVSRRSLKLTSQSDLARGLRQFEFRPDRPLAYRPGQYLEWTLPHRHPDGRGYRRYFTIASSPTEPGLLLGVRIDPRRSSSFKQALLALQPGHTVAGGQLAGDFTLPTQPGVKLVFIAGGIGVTPFRSMVKYLTDTRQSVDVTLIYTAPGPDDFAYRDVFDAGAAFGIATHYVLTDPDQVPPGWTGQTGRISDSMLARLLPGGFSDHTFYLSGPSAMVASYKKLLKQAGVASKNIKTDYFPGF